jgi:cytochrome c-type biogenesis protein CcsB
MNLVSLQGSLDNASFGVLLGTMLIYWVAAIFPGLAALQNLGTAGMAIANLCMAALLAARWMEAGYFPLSNLYESLFFLAWGITTMHLVAEQMSRSRLVGAVTAPVAMGITAFAALTLPDTMQHSEPLVPALKSNWLMMHVSVMMLSYATLMVGALLAIAFLVVTRGQTIDLKGNSVGLGGFRLVEKASAIAATGAETRAETRVETGTETVPGLTMVSAIMGMSDRSEGTIALQTPTLTDKLLNQTAPLLSPQLLTLADTLDNISYRIIGLGFPLLTIGIIAGGVWANEAWGSYWSWDPKETWALITWLVFAAYLHARITRGWQGRKPALLAAVGFVVVWICYLGVNLLGKGLHSYGWFL